MSERHDSTTSDREMAEQLLRFRMLADAAFEGIGISRQGIIIDVNEQLAAKLGYQRNEMIGHPVGKFVAVESRDQVQQAIESRRTDRYEHLAIRKDGTRIAVEVRGRMVGTGADQVRLTAVRDISEQKKAEQALRESEERFRAVVESSPDCIVVAVDERVVYLNPAGAKIFGVADLGGIMGRSVYDFVPDEILAEVKERRRSVLERGVVACAKEGRLLRMDGAMVTVEAISVPFVYAGKQAIMNLIRDISEHKRLEEENAKAVAREQKAREEFTRELIASQEAERRRISAELHDSLGQKLLLINNRARLALGGAGGTDAVTQLEGISALATAAIDEVRQISHALHPYQLDHLGLTGALGAMIDDAGRATSVVFERKLDQVDEVFGKDAATHLYRVVQESLNNVMKHSGATHARVVLERDVREVILQVHDNGFGFNSEKVEGDGHGFRNIAERVRILGGTLAVRSSAEEGTCVEIKVPIRDLE